jgi:hypothetical protein
MAYNGFSYTDTATTLRPRTYSIYAQQRQQQEEWLQQRWPKFSLYDALVKKVGDAKSQSVHGYTPVGAPAIQNLSQGLSTVYRTGSGDDGNVAPVPTYAAMAESLVQTKVGNVFSTPVAQHSYFQTAKNAFTQFLLPGSLQQPRWGEFFVERGTQRGANLFLDGDSVQFMDNPMQILKDFAKQGEEALLFDKNLKVYFAALAAGVNTEVVGNYGDREALGINNQTNGTTDGYQMIDLFTPASIPGAYAGLYKTTAQTDGVQLNATGGAMAGTRRILGNNVPTKIIGAGNGALGLGRLTDSEMQMLKRFRNKRNRSQDSYVLFVDPIDGIEQLQNIPEVRNMSLNSKALDYNQQHDRDLGQVTPYGFSIKTCPSIIPMGANSQYSAIFAPMSGGQPPMRSIVNEEINTREIPVPFRDDKRPNMLLRISSQIGVGVAEPGELAIIHYKAA